MTTINDFKPTEDNTKFEGIINNISVQITEDRLSDEVVQYADKIVKIKRGEGMPITIIQ